MKKYLVFCKNCINKPENEYRLLLAGELLWENKNMGHSGFSCSKCEKVFKVKEKMFLSISIK